MSVIAVYNLTPDDLDRLFRNASTTKSFKVTEVAKRYRDSDPYSAIVDTELDIASFKDRVLLGFDYPAGVVIEEMV